MVTGELALSIRGGHQASADLGHVRPHCAAAVHVPSSPKTPPEPRQTQEARARPFLTRVPSSHCSDRHIVGSEPLRKDSLALWTPPDVLRTTVSLRHACPSPEAPPQSSLAFWHEVEPRQRERVQENRVTSFYKCHVRLSEYFCTPNLQLCELGLTQRITPGRQRSRSQAATIPAPSCALIPTPTLSPQTPCSGRGQRCSWVRSGKRAG